MDDWSQSNQVVILIIFIWPIIVYNDTLFIIVWVISKVKFEDGHFPRDSHSWRWCYICEVWRLKMLWPIYFTNQYALNNIFSLYVYNFILPTILSIPMTLMSLKISLTVPILRKVLPNITFLFTYYYPIFLSSLIFFKIEKKIHL